MNNHFDVIVIGLGAMGSASVYQLSRMGVRVLGLDQFEPPHTLGSSHGETRMTRMAVGEGAAYVPLIQRSNAIWAELEAQTGDMLHRFTGGYIISPTQGRSAFHGQDDFATRTAQIAQQYGIAHSMHTAAEVRQRLPMLNVRDDEHAYYEATHGMVVPERCVRLQLALARQQGAVLHTGERVLSYTTTSDGVTVTTDRDTYQADNAIISAGAWVKSFLPARQHALTQIYRQHICWFEADDLDTFTGARFPWVLWTFPDMHGCFGVFSRFEDGTPAVKCLTEIYDTTVDPNTADRNVSEAEIDAMYERFVRPLVRGLRRNCLKAAACLYTNTPDEGFIIDQHPEHARVWVASPCSGHGFKHSAAIGEALAQCVTHGHSKLDLSAFSFNRFH